MCLGKPAGGEGGRGCRPRACGPARGRGGQSVTLGCVAAAEPCRV